jgi:hypothetical protein
MRLRALAFISVFFLVVGCVHHEMSAREMIADMHDIKSGKRTMINILWYNGSDAKFDYFGYVYNMLGGKNYKVPVGQFVLHRIPLTNDESKWLRIREIEGLWVASRGNSEGIWREDREGISIQAAR